MATNTTNYGLTKPAYSDTADIADINGNMDTVDSEMTKLSNSVAVVEFGNTATQAIASGKYVVWKGNLYKANQAISSGATLSGKLTSVSGGGLNDVYSSLNGKIITEDSSITNGHRYRLNSSTDSSLAQFDVTSSAFVLLGYDSTGTQTHNIDISAFKYYTYKRPSELGLTNGSATILQIWNTMRTYGPDLMILSSADIASGDRPAGNSAYCVVIVKNSDARGYIKAFSKNGASSYWMGLGPTTYNGNDANAPTGKWVASADSKTQIETILQNGTVVIPMGTHGSAICQGFVGGEGAVILGIIKFTSTLTVKNLMTGGTYSGNLAFSIVSGGVQVKNNNSAASELTIIRGGES